VIDLAPGRSLAEYLIGQGLQVFIISWRNPDARYAKRGFDTYGQAILDAMAAAARAGRRRSTSCSGTRTTPG
jgi:polyhydroxyalkanoate synthase